MVILFNELASKSGNMMVPLIRFELFEACALMYSVVFWPVAFLKLSVMLYRVVSLRPSWKAALFKTAS